MVLRQNDIPQHLAIHLAECHIWAVHFRPLAQELVGLLLRQVRVDMPHHLKDQFAFVFRLLLAELGKAEVFVNLPHDCFWHACKPLACMPLQQPLEVALS